MEHSDWPALTDLRRRHDAVLDEHRPDTVAKQHRRGQLTARERIALLLDDGATFLESGALAQPANPALRAEADAVVVGLGDVHGRRAAVISYDYTVLGGTQGHVSHAKTARLLRLAEQYEAPVFVLAEGGGARTLELTYLRDGPSAPGGDFELLARLSGQVPLIGLGLGRAFAGHAILLAECDVIIATEAAAIGVAGPPLVKAATGEDLTPEQIGAARIHEAAGSVERIAADDRDAVALARAYAHFIVRPTVHSSKQPDVAESLRRAAFSPGPRDARHIVELLGDPGSTFELRPTWSTEVITTLARIAGHAVGIVATDPRVDGGRLTAAGCDKITRFVGLCNAFRLPLVFMVDTEGIARESGQASVRHAARISIKLSTLDSPMITFVTGKVGGVAQILLGGFGRILDGPPHLLWPTASVVGLGVVPDDPRSQALGLAEAFVTDDVIDTGRTREVAIAWLSTAGRLTVRPSQRPIDPW
jgi:acetyl-CoA carboxylase carboxyltransferase component